MSFLVGDQIHQVGPKNMDSAEARRLLERFGPVSGTVLASLRDIGIPAKRDELDELEAWVAISKSRIDGPERLGGPVRTAMLAWRSIALFAQVCEEVAALAHAIARWHQQGRPRYMECDLGEAYLTWAAEGSVSSTLAAWRQPQGIQALVRYPDRAELMPFLVSTDDARRIAEVCRRSRRGAADAVGSLSELVTRDVWRTFIRWKHRLTATIPSVVPIWVPRQKDGQRESIDERLRSGFAVMDSLAKGDPELIVWPAEPEDLKAYLDASRQGLQVLILLLDATLRYGLLGVPALPWFVEESRALSERELRALNNLESSNYRWQRLIGEVPPHGSSV